MAKVKKVTTVHELEALCPGSVISSPLPDTESNVAEKTSDGFWLVVGEQALFDNGEMAEWADEPYTVLRHGYSGEKKDSLRLYHIRLANLTKEA